MYPEGRTFILKKPAGKLINRIFRITILLTAGFQTLTWLRIVGGSLFVLGGIIPLAWFITTRRKNFKQKKYL